MKMKNRTWKLYSNIKSQLLEISKDVLIGGVRRSDYLLKTQVIADPKMSGLVVDIGDISPTPSLEGVKLLFFCDTFAKWPTYYHLVKVIESKGDRSIPIVRKSWILNRETHLFAKMIHGFTQGLYNYAFQQWSTESLADSFGVPVRLVPETFGWTLEDWEREFEIPSLGTDDVIGSFMRHVYDGTLELTGKAVLDK